MNTMNPSPARRAGDAVVAAPTRSLRSRSLLSGLVVGWLLIAALILTGCTAEAESAPTTAAGAEGAITVRMVDSTFEPQTVTVKVGDTVTWVNEDSVSHNAVADDESWGTDIFGEGGTASITFDTPGVQPYNCTLHAGMVGTVIVE